MEISKSTKKQNADPKALMLIQLISSLFSGAPQFCELVQKPH